MKQLEPIVDYLSTNPSVESIILFGSRARGTNTPYADIDLAVSCPKTTDREWARIWNDVQELPLLLNVDLVRLDKMRKAFQKQVLKEGKYLYKKD